MLRENFTLAVAMSWPRFSVFQKDGVPFIQVHPSFVPTVLRPIVMSKTDVESIATASGAVGAEKL